MGLLQPENKKGIIEGGELEGLEPVREIAVVSEPGTTTLAHVADGLQDCPLY